MSESASQPGTALARPRELTPAQMFQGVNYIKGFGEVSRPHLASVGPATALFAEIYQELTGNGIRVPNGFTISIAAYRDFLIEAGLHRRIRQALCDLDRPDHPDLPRRGAEIRQALLAAELPSGLVEQVIGAYAFLSERGPIEVAIHCQEVSEDYPDAAAVPPSETFWKVSGRSAVLETCKSAFAAVFSDQAIARRIAHGLDHCKAALSIAVQAMVASTPAASGMMFTTHTEVGFQDVALVNASAGLSRTTGAQNSPLDGGRWLNPPQHSLVEDITGGKRVRQVSEPSGAQTELAISDEEVLKLARWACLIDDHYSVKYGRPTSMQIGWAKDGATGELFIIQASPTIELSRQRPDDMARLQSFQKNSQAPVFTEVWEENPLAIEE